MEDPQCNIHTTETTTNHGFTPEAHAPLTTQPHEVAERGFAAKFGLCPPVALFTLVIDLMLNGGEIASMGLLIPLSIAVACVVGVITFVMQRKYYGDDTEAALTKGLMLATLTAVPTALPAMLYVPAGILGLFHRGEK